MDLIGLITSAAGGGVLGILGKLATMWMQARVDKQTQQLERDKMSHELAVMRLELEGSKQVAMISAQADVEVAAQQALAASYASDRATYSSQFVSLSSRAKYLLVLVDFARGMTRPAITWGALFIVSMLACFSKTNAIQTEALNALIFTATTCVTWWFADRRKDLGD